MNAHNARGEAAHFESLSGAHLRSLERLRREVSDDAELVEMVDDIAADARKLLVRVHALRRRIEQLGAHMDFVQR